MTFHEYPKARYLKGAYMAVNDAEHEAEMAALGWTDWHSDQEIMAGPKIGKFIPSPDAEGVPADAFSFVAAASPVTESAPERKKPGRPPKAK